MGKECDKEEYDKLMADMMAKRAEKKKEFKETPMEPVKFLTDQGDTPETAYRVVVEGVKLEIEDILKNAKKGGSGYNICCVQGCCISWCCVQLG